MSLMTGRDGTGISGETSEVYSDLSKLPPLGSKAHDANGNEYVLVDFGASQPATGFQYGEFVVFDSAFLATRIGTSGRGWVGVVMAGSAAATITTTNRYGWVQVYGIHTRAWGTSDVTSATLLYVSATTDLGRLEGLAHTTTTTLAIFGVRSCSAGDTCASTALSMSSLAAPFTAMLNYPFVNGALNPVAITS